MNFSDNGNLLFDTAVLHVITLSYLVPIHVLSVSVSISHCIHCPFISIAPLLIVLTVISHLSITSHPSSISSLIGAIFTGHVKLLIPMVISMSAIQSVVIRAFSSATRSPISNFLNDGLSAGEIENYNFACKIVTDAPVSATAFTLHLLISTWTFTVTVFVLRITISSSCELNNSLVSPSNSPPRPASSTVWLSARTSASCLHELTSASVFEYKICVLSSVIICASWFEIKSNWWAGTWPTVTAPSHLKVCYFRYPPSVRLVSRFVSRQILLPQHRTVPFNVALLVTMVTSKFSRSSVLLNCSFCCPIAFAFFSGKSYKLLKTLSSLFPFCTGLHNVSLRCLCRFVRCRPVRPAVCWISSA